MLLDAITSMECFKYGINPQEPFKVRFRQPLSLFEISYGLR